MSITLPTSTCPECRERLVVHEYQKDHVFSFLGEDSTRITIERQCPRCNWVLVATLTKGPHGMDQQQLELVT